MQCVRRAAPAMTEIERLAERLSPRPAGKCLLGLSGGADSAALAHMLVLLRDAGEIQLEAAIAVGACDTACKQRLD